MRNRRDRCVVENRRTRALENCGRLLVSVLTSGMKNLQSVTEPGLAARFGITGLCAPISLGLRLSG